MNPDARFARASTDPDDKRFGVLDQTPRKEKCYGCGNGINVYERVMEDPEVGYFWGHNTEGVILRGKPYCLPTEQPQMEDLREPRRYAERARSSGCAAKVDPTAVERILHMRLAAFSYGTGPEDFAEGRSVNGVLATEEV